MAVNRNSRRKMSPQEAGRKGGEATKRKHGPEFYAEIGQKGGVKVSRDRAHMSAIGGKGGRSRQRQS